MQRGKGKKDRYALLTEPLLAELRLYWTIYRPKIYLFEGAIAGTPIAIRTVQKVFHNACERCFILRKVGAPTGMIAVLHTWGQNLHFHPHVHCIVPGGGWCAKSKKCCPGRRSCINLQELTQRVALVVNRVK